MSKDDFVYLAHMVDLGQSATNRVAAITKDDFDADENLRLAVPHLIQTIGEAARRVSSEFREGHPSIPWKQVIGMRHKLLHYYMHVDYDLV